MKEEKTELKFLMEKLKIDMAKLEELRRTEADGRKLGIISINQLQMQLADMRHSFQESMRTSESQDDPVKMKIALQKAKEAHTFLLTKLTQMETDYVDVVPRKQFEEASEKMKIMGEDLEVLTKHCKALQSTLE
ncbi:Translin-associated factor X-interacting protein 1 [Sparganum proliferum]